MKNNINNFDENLIKLANLFSEVGETLYAVGGMVRNPLLGLPISDIDVCSKMPVDEVINFCKKNDLHFVPKGLAYGTVEIHIGGISVEHTTFRADSYGEGGSHKPESVKFSTSLESDAVRRDFTVNALYCNILSGEIKDPTGGLDDIKNGIIRATSKDAHIILKDDALRILRMVRFAAQLGFDIDNDTFLAAKENISGLQHISPERIRDELNKILLSDVRYKEYVYDENNSVLKGLELLKELGAFKYIIPELELGIGIEQKPTHHKYDVFNHALHTCACSAPSLIMRLAGLLHDIGKPIVFKENGNMHFHDMVGETLSRDILKRLKYDNATVDAVSKIVRYHMYDLNGTAKGKTLKRQFARWGYDFTLRICEIREADVHGSGFIKGEVKSAVRWRKVLDDMVMRGAPFSEKDIACTGKDIALWLSIPPSKEIGEIKQKLLMHCAVFPKHNNKQDLEWVVKTIYKKDKKF